MKNSFARPEFRSRRTGTLATQATCGIIALSQFVERAKGRDWDLPLTLRLLQV